MRKRMGWETKKGKHKGKKTKKKKCEVTEARKSKRGKDDGDKVR